MSNAPRSQAESLPRKTEIPGWVTIVVMLLVYIVTVAGLFASVRTTTEEHTQQIRELQQNTVTRREMDDVKNWLQRIDGKLDKALENNKR